MRITGSEPEALRAISLGQHGPRRFNPRHFGRKSQRELRIRLGRYSRSRFIPLEQDRRNLQRRRRLWQNLRRRAFTWSSISRFLLWITWSTFCLARDALGFIGAVS